MNSLKNLITFSLRGLILGCLYLGITSQAHAEMAETIVEVPVSDNELVSLDGLSIAPQASGNAIISQESAVERALQWLAEHQEADGSWDSTKYEGQMLRSASTAMALLPFLGAGHCEMAGKYRKTVRKGVRYLNDLMKDPVISYENIQSDFLSTALVLQALSEDSIFGSSPETRNNSNILAEYLMALYKNRMLRKSGFGEEGEWCESMWFTLAIKSAKAADLPITKTSTARECYDLYKYFLAKETSEWTWRLDSLALNPKIEDVKRTWVLMSENQVMSAAHDDPFLKKAAESTCALYNHTEWMEGENMRDPLVIYFLHLAAFQQQGDMWCRWNPYMKKMVVSSQQQGEPNEFGGSWDPASERVIKKGGRIFSTALITLCLEVYHR